MMKFNIFTYIIFLLIINSNFLSANQDLIFKKDTIELNEVNINEKSNNNFQFNFIRGLFNNQIYSGKKNELIIVKDKNSTAINNARSIYNQSASLNILQTDDAGLQLNIGGRGLDPKRTSNFNVRQNYYDISADPLGYPESYYVPPFESLSSIELVRGAASLQYGTQFGGFLNFNIKKPNRKRKIELLTRNTFASNKLYTNFSSISGSNKKLGYYLFHNIKNGDGFRPNSHFDSKTFYTYFDYNLNDIIDLSFEMTNMKYLCQQPGGLTDDMFYENMFQSNRARNWFEVRWLLYNFKTKFEFSNNTNILVNIFSLNADRKSVGFRTNRVNQVDSDQVRDLILSNFNNFGLETSISKELLIFKRKSTILIGNKIFFGETDNIQGPGSSSSDADFNLYNSTYPNYEFQSNYKNPNYNSAIFIENKISLSKNFTLIPGLRYEYINTKSNGSYRVINLDNAGNVILNEVNNSNESKTRSFFLFGMGLSYIFPNSIEFYGNLSQNYRAVTFADINIVNPSFTIDPNISDEDGYNIDFGVRGSLNRSIKFDVSSFYMFYNNRIGFVQRTYSDNSVKNEKGNIGNATIFGIESLLNFSFSEFFNFNNDHNLSFYLNNSFLFSEYISSDISAIVGNNVEFVPNHNIKSGISYNFKKFNFDLQYTYLSSQYTDATNSVESDLSGLIGLIPSYSVLDISLSYSYNNIMLEAGCNNVLDKYYFTTRATGYPGPGIIPSINRNFYVTLEFKL